MDSKTFGTIAVLSVILLKTQELIDFFSNVGICVMDATSTYFHRIQIPELILNTLDFSECRSEEVIGFFLLDALVYIQAGFN